MLAQGLELRAVWTRSGEYYFAYPDGRPWAGEMGPVQHLLAAVVGCVGITMQSILTKMKIDHNAITIDAVATKADRNPTYVQSISLRATVHGAAAHDAQLLARVSELTEKNCLVAQTLKRSSEVTMSAEMG